MLTTAIAEHPLVWQSARMAEPLTRDAIHLWLVMRAKSTAQSMKPTADAERETLSSVTPATAMPVVPIDHADLTASELTRAARLGCSTRRAQYLDGRVGLRVLLQHYSGLANQQLQFGAGPRGKPCLLNAHAHGTLHFNYTIAREYILYSFAWGRELGVDLEVMPRRIATARLASRILSPREQKTWRALARTMTAAAQNDAMLYCWTRKEAYGKQLGVGIRYHMPQVSLFCDPTTPQWQVTVGGLFDAAAPNPTTIAGVQLQMPMPAAAALMYAPDDPAATTHAVKPMKLPKLLAYQTRQHA